MYTACSAPASGIDGDVQKVVTARTEEIKIGAEMRYDAVAAWLRRA